MTRVAACHCGALTVSCEGEPRKVSLCHCKQCQRRTGSAFSVAVFFASEHVTVSGASVAYTRASASGQPVEFRFCPVCGSNLFWRPTRMPHLVGVALGGFADPDFPPPEQAVWAAEGCRWVTLPDDVPSFDANPPPRN